MDTASNQTYLRYAILRTQEQSGRWFKDLLALNQKEFGYTAIQVVNLENSEYLITLEFADNNLLPWSVFTQTVAQLGLNQIRQIPKYKLVSAVEA